MIMEFTVKLDMLQTVAFAIFLLFVGSFFQKRINVLSKYNIPVPVIGGLIFSFLNWGLQSRGITLQFDTMLQDVFMIAFFTSIGMGASIKFIAEGGMKLLTFLAAAAVLVVLQNFTAWGLSSLTGLNPLMGLLAGSITMSGGHGTGATFANYFARRFHFPGTMEMAMASATFGLISGSLMGGPIARWLINRHNLKPSIQAASKPDPLGEEIEMEKHIPIHEWDILRTIFQFAICISCGTILYEFAGEHGVKVPTYLFALMIGIVVRNAADFTPLYKFNVRMAEMIGATSLSIFLSMALMSMRLWELADLAGPMIVILSGQVVLMALYAIFVTYRTNGRDYEAAVLVGGHCGFGMGATPNAIANMQAITNTYGPAPGAFYVTSIVGAFFIDIINAFVIQGFIWFLS
jgi:ESS family glutamate:Na+ symporter